MKNRTLSLIRRVIPYSPDMRSLPLVSSVLDVILLQQLDYWFENNPNGFYKFLEPNSNELYKAGDSWTEELAISKKEFKKAFSHIGTAYTSKGQFNKSHDRFQDKYYCSYYDRIKRLTFYFRNHEKLDFELDKIMGSKPQSGLSACDQRYSLEVTDGNFQKRPKVTSISIDTKNTYKDYYTDYDQEARARKNLDKADFLPKKELTNSEPVGLELTTQDTLNEFSLTKKPNENKSPANQKQIAPGCNTPVPQAVPQGKPYYQLKANDFKWINELWKQHRMEWEADADILFITNRVLATLKDAYQTCNSDLGTMRHLLEKALIYRANNEPMQKYDLFWFIDKERFIEIAQRTQNKVLTKSFKQQAIDDEDNYKRAKFFEMLVDSE